MASFKNLYANDTCWKYLPASGEKYFVAAVAKSNTVKNQIVISVNLSSHPRVKFDKLILSNSGESSDIYCSQFNDCFKVDKQNMEVTNTHCLPLSPFCIHTKGVNSYLTLYPFPNNEENSINFRACFSRDKDGSCIDNELIIPLDKKVKMMIFSKIKCKS